MKEPDFRLWCRSEKRMGKVIEIRHDCIDCISTVHARFYIGHQRLDRYYRIIPQARYKDVSIMQALGVRDRNGNMIYEGDIVQLGDGRIISCTFRDNDDLFGFMGIEFVRFQEEFEMYGGGVLGNIYEHNIHGEKN